MMSRKQAWTRSGKMATFSVPPRPPPWGHCEKWPKGTFLWLCVPIDDWLRWATFRIGPKGLLYGLVARFSRILLHGGEAWWEVPLSITNREKSLRATS